MDGPAFAAIPRSLLVPGSRRRAVVAALGGTLTALASRATTAKKKKGKGHKRQCPECGTCPAPLDTCPQRVCCSCTSFGGTPTSCHYLPSDTCGDVCSVTSSRILPTPGRANMCTADLTCTVLNCPVL
jgi:hypothetical protein